MFLLAKFKMDSCAMRGYVSCVCLRVSVSEEVVSSVGVHENVETPAELTGKVSVKL